MSTSAEELTRTFWAAFPADFIEDLMRLLASEYRTAKIECDTFYPDEEAHDLCPHVRRAKIECRVRELASAFPGITATAEPNAAGTSYHTRVVSHGVTLVINHVAQPTDMVRRAEFRNTYARLAQGSLFEPDEPPPQDGMLFAILLHGASKRDPRRPDFVQVAFPDAECKHYIHRIDLFAIPRFKSLANELWPARVEEVEDDLDMGLRSDAKKKNRKKQGD